MTLSEATREELVEELAKRDGVEWQVAPYYDANEHLKKQITIVVREV